MAPTESEILTNFLLQPASLTSIVTFEQFEALFPRSLHGSPQLRSLFRELRAQRNAVLDDVAANIAAEVKRGNVMRAEVIRARRAAETEEVDGEVELERALYGADAAAKPAKHSLNSIIPDLDAAVAAIEAELARLGEEEAKLTELVTQTIGGLSDLRHGKFANAQLRDEVMDGLASLEQSCKNKNS
jgi:centromere-localized protein 2